MCMDNLDSGRSGDSQPGIRTYQHRSAKPASYRDAFINSELRWENYFQEWGLQELEIEGSNDSVIGGDGTADGIPSINLDIDTQMRIIQPWIFS